MRVRKHEPEGEGEKRHALTFDLSAGIANESGGITFIPVQVSVTGQAGAALQPLPPQALAGTIAVQPATVKPAPKPASGALRKGSLSLFFRKVRARAHAQCGPASAV